MELELWWLLGLPLFFVLGWLAARIDIKQLLSESRALPSSYFKGLNFLLKEQPDKAIEAFIELAKIDSQTVELQFALGGLFRRRGEVDRAIRMHQNLLDRPDLVGEQRAEAVKELGKDYLKAGLFDRAEELFIRLKGTSFEEQGLANLLEIYEQEKDWVKAVQVSESLEKFSDNRLEVQVAHYLCELSVIKIENKNVEKALVYLEEALVKNPLCVRASILKGDIYKYSGNREAAISSWRSIEQQEPSYLSLVASRVLDAYNDLNIVDEGLELLQRYLRTYPSFDMLSAVFGGYMEHGHVESANRILRNTIREDSNLLVLKMFLQTGVSESDSEIKSDLLLFHQILQKNINNLELYNCKNCGFKAKVLHWHCPACAKWETYSAQRLGESVVDY